MYTCIQYTVYLHTGKGGGCWTREKVTGSTVHKAGSKILDWLHLQSINSDIHLPQSLFTGKVFYEAQNPITPTPLYTWIQYIHSVRYLFTQCWTREKVRGATVNKAGLKIPDWLYLQSITLIYTCRKVSLPINFLDDEILLWCLISPCSQLPRPTLAGGGGGGEEGVWAGGERETGKQAFTSVFPY